ncbi:MAG: hypothetical protein HGB22_03015 [Chlorobiaceae bacterium]|nr:hypothetical protein [Chlorobiaceae bacterium]
MANLSLINASVDGLGNIVTLYFSEVLDTVHLPSISQFVVDNSGSKTISGLQVVNNQVILNLDSPLNTALPVTVSYTDPTGGNDTNAIQGIAGIDLASFSNVVVNNALELTPSLSETFSLGSSIALPYGAEISAFDEASGRLFVTSPNSGLQVVQVDSQYHMTLLGTISLGSNDVNSVAVKNGIVAVAVAAADKTQPGSVYFLDADGTVGNSSMIIGSATVGALPDMLTFSADGSKVLVANEGERNTPADITALKSAIDPDGSVSIIDISDLNHISVTTASFDPSIVGTIADLKAEGVRLFAGNTGFETTTLAQDLEPEYISISPDGAKAFVTLQENNAIGILDLDTASPTYGKFTDIVPLGLKSFLGLPFDGSDKDGGINLQTDQPVFGQRMPDGISSFTGSDGKTYYVIANEGDDRNDFLSSSTPEAVRLSTLDLDNTAFPNEAALKTNAEIGRLTVSNASGNNGDTNGDGDIDQILTYGSRSFSILDEHGTLVFDSGSHIEQFVAGTGAFNSQDPANSGLFIDTRSDNKGPEPEGVSIGQVDGRTLAFIGLERAAGAILVYDVTNPLDVTFVQCLQNPDESQSLVGADGAAYGAGPEGLNFVTFNQQNLLFVSNEYSKTVSLYHQNSAPTVDQAISDVSKGENTPFTFMVPAGTFQDLDTGDSLTYTATLADGSALPSWLHFDGELQGALNYTSSAMDSYFSLGTWAGNVATDSASAATAMSTGVKTDGGNICWLSGDPVNGSLTTIAETLKADLGYAIGVVTTVPFSHATPAGFVSHNVSRSNYQDIAHEILFTTEPDVVIGGGLDSLFAKAVKNSAGQSTDLDGNGYNDDYDVFRDANPDNNNGYSFVQRETGVDGGTALAAKAAEVDITNGDKLFGLFGTSGGNFEYYNVSDTPGTPTITRSTTDSTPAVDEDPTLAEMTLTTLSVLNKDPQGFFVMFEQGDIDWSNHANDYENMVGGTYDLEQAVTAAETMVGSSVNGMDWSNTLMIVTSDHSNSYMRLQQEAGLGNLLDKAAGEVTYSSVNHTNELVTLQARGAGAQLFSEYAGRLYAGTDIVDNTDIYNVMKSAAEDLGVDHIILFIGDGMNIEHEIAASQYLYGKDFGLTWQDWGQLEDGWAGYASTWDVTSYNTYAAKAGVAAYSPSTFDPAIGYNTALGGETPLPIGVTFSGTADHSDVGSLEILVTATDESGATSSDTFNLTVTDSTAPTVTAFNPVDGATGVAIDSTIQLTFSENVELHEGTIAIHSGSVTGLTVASDISVSGNTLTLDPTGLLSNDTEYFVTFSDGSLADLSGNHYGGTSSFNFSTVAAAHAISGSGDGGSATGVLVGAGALGLLAMLIF